MNILILATSKTSHAVKRLRYEALKRGHKVLIVNPMDLFLLISNSESGYDRLYYVSGGKVRRLNIKDYDAVIPRIGDNTGYGAFLVAQLNENLRLFSTNSAEGIRNATNQLKTLQVLSSNGIPTPRTVFAQNPAHIDYLIEKVGGYPIICKLTHGSGGSGVSLLKDKKTAIPILQSLFKSRSSVIIQEYLDSGRIDYRVIVLGGTVVGSFKRTASSGQYRANLKQDGKGSPVQLDEADKLLCINAARALNLGAVGIDLIKHYGKTYVIEANANFGWGIEKITGLNIGEMMIQYCVQNYQAKNIEKSQALSYQRQLADERMSNDALARQVESLNERISFFTDDKYLRNVFKKAKGKNVKYQDRSKNSKRVKVENMGDVFRIMIDTFIVK